MSVFHLPIPFQASKNDDPQARGGELAADLSYWGAVVVRWQGNPSTDFVISEQGEVRRVVHLPTGMEIVAIRVTRDPLAVPLAYTTEAEVSDSHHPQEVAQAALRHLRVWLMRKNGKGRRGNP